jgi:hypothetical protein
MKLIMTILVRDEADVLDANLRHHLDLGVDFIVATDNLSVDGTPDILRTYERDGVLASIEEPSDDYSQHRWVTRMAQEAATQHGGDWIINNDADEFWWPRSGDLRSTLEAVPPEVGIVVAQRRDFVIRPDDDRPFWDRMTHRWAVPRHHDGGQLPPKVCHRADPAIRVLQGNHEVDSAVLGSELDDGRIEILHFPMRSYAQFANKIALGGAALRRNTELPVEVVHRWRELFAEMERAGGLDAQWASWTMSDADVDRLVDAGELDEDVRLRDRMRGLSPTSAHR